MVNMKLLRPHAFPTDPGTTLPWRYHPDISGGGLFHDLAPHQLDLMLYYFGAWKDAVGRSANVAGLYAADDSTSGTIVFENGVMFNGVWSFVVPREESADECEIIGSGGSIRFGVFDQQGISLATAGRQENFAFETLQHVQQPLIEKVVQYFRGEAPNPCPIEVGVSVMQLMDAFTQPLPQLVPQQ